MMGLEDEHNQEKEKEEINDGNNHEGLSPTSIATNTTIGVDIGNNDLILRGIQPPSPPSEPPYSTRERALFAATLEESKKALTNLGELVETVIGGSTNQYDTMKTMNETISEDYIEEFNNTISNQLIPTIHKARNNFLNAEEFSNLIFDVERQVARMESIVNEMDTYTIALEQSTKKRSELLAPK